MIVTIDGPAGAGKSTVARRLAQRLGFRFLDTGAMYRAVAWAAARDRVDWSDASAIAQVAQRLRIELPGSRVLVDGDDVTTAIRASEITSVTHYAADNPQVREHLVGLQRLAAGNDNVVSEGRDQGTVVFPDAACKIFLTASPSERARRRLADLAARGESRELAEVLAEQTLRDERDSAREVGPLIPAVDAVHVSTDELEIDEVVDAIERLVRSRMDK
ncbi:MAG: (d)CMP kinase [Pirellulales bacterium]|nr:(d)CMP kinase [Pirellulales bacterium]